MTESVQLCGNEESRRAGGLIYLGDEDVEEDGIDGKGARVFLRSGSLNPRIGSFSLWNGMDADAIGLGVGSNL